MIYWHRSAIWPIGLHIEEKRLFSTIRIEMLDIGGEFFRHAAGQAIPSR
jgi:hypothetical protein